jgi:hypothetical protein
MVRKLITVIDGRIVPEMENGTADAQQFLRADWQAEVDAGKTKLEYQEWLQQLFPAGEEE